MSDVQSQGPSSDELRDRFQTLERVAILFTLSDNILRALARRMRPVPVRKGTEVIHQGTTGDSMFIIASGRAEVTVEESAGHSITIAFLGPGDFFGEMALISEETRSATVRTLEDCQLLELDRRTLYETLQPMALPRCEVAPGPVPGRSGTVLRQGVEFLADVDLAAAA